MDVVEAGGRVHRFDHVEDRQGRHTGGCQRLHLHAGAVGGAHRGGEFDGVLTDAEFDVDTGEGKWMTQWDEVTGAFGCQNSGDAGGGQRVTFGRPPTAIKPITSGLVWTVADAVALRAVTALAVTSTIRAAPSSSTCDRRRGAWDGPLVT